ncbi:MBL fold metallo-hydrolase [Subtercola frigoramans]|uniref:Glyoxylase-like metal-dependent hydrolase (Beta-lactamase superfamily II) n=1 Tax=Subtercola frigoramans TaxID=120298 RepID=A0ABS2L7M4_9MICO|nr:MBL fold metallo-hydrolase [Subtercola frigoramans]MBM7472881.1 glyoxylase-like metal-dependent hydrolase (beta-lactamase superfamily II) [Subtercola frigoramans]
MQSIAANVWKLDLPIPGSGPATVAAYLLRADDGGLHLIDPGWGEAHSMTFMTTALESLGSTLADVTSVIVTHFHPDHLGFARELQRRGVPLTLPAREQQAIREERDRMPVRHISLHAQYERWGVPREVANELITTFDYLDAPDVQPDVMLEDLEQLAIPGFDLHLVATPGHTDGHGCYVELRRELLFSGDHILSEMNSGIGLGGASPDPLQSYLESLEKLAIYDQFQLLPGHGEHRPTVGDRRKALLAHHHERSREIEQLLESAPSQTTWELASRVRWSGGWAGLHGTHLASALTQTAQHRTRLETLQA